MAGQRIAIYCFSGTGNTEFVVKTLADELRKGGNEVDTEPIDIGLIRRAKAGEVETNGYDMVGIAHAVHAWNPPRAVPQFARLLPKGGGKPAFLLCCSAGDMLHGGATTRMRRILRRRGYDVFHESQVLMPTNMAARTEPDEGRAKIQAARERVGEIADELAARQRSLAENTIGNRVFTAVMGASEAWGARAFGHYLSAEESCTRCGLCARRCPSGNVTMADSELPRFGWSCLWCLRCVYACPVQAIKPRLFGSMTVKGGYNVEEYLD